MSVVAIERKLLATCWTSAVDVAPPTPGQLSPIPIRERVEAIGATGWVGMGLLQSDLAAIKSTIGYRDFGRLLEENGIAHLELEFLTDWWTSGELRSSSDRLRAELFEAATLLGVEVIKVAPNLDGSPVDISLMEHEFDRLATDAGREGLKVALEPMPFSNLNSVKDAIALVTNVANPDGGLAIDSWHTVKGGTSHSELAACLPLDYTFLVELADGTIDTPGSFAEDAVFGRLEPGDGELNLPEFVRRLHDLGYRGLWGVEIMSDAHRALPVREALERSFAATMRTLDQAERLSLTPAL